MIPLGHASVFRFPSSQRGRYYNVDLAALTCDCDNFAGHYSIYPERDVRRLCRHLSRTICNLATFEIPRILFYFLQANGGAVWPFDLAEELVIGPDLFVLTYQVGTPWVNVYGGEAGSPWHRYGYSLSERKTWSYGKAPDNRTEIIERIQVWNPQNLNQKL